MFFRPRSRFCSGLNTGLAFIAALLVSPLGLAAEPLDKEACDRLQAEKQALVVLGVDKEFAKGPDWAKANLGLPELNLLKRFMTLDEQLKFRCGMSMVTLDIPDEPGDVFDGDVVAAPAPPPLPSRRDQAVLKPAAVNPAGGPAVAKPANPAPPVNAAGAPAVAKPALPAAKPENAATKPAMPAAVPAKPAPKPAPAKAQSSWNTQTAPADAVAPSTLEQAPAKPKPERVRQLESGDQSFRF